jgi:hypothetical protein
MKFGVTINARDRRNVAHRRKLKGLILILGNSLGVSDHEKYVCLTVNCTQQATLYTLSWQLLSASKISHYQATNPLKMKHVRFV